MDAPDSLVLDVRGGARLCVPASLDRITSYVLLEQEDWFEEEIRFVRRWLRPGMRAIDVGANLGVYAVAMARAVGSGGRVWALEPTPDTAAYLQRNLALNGCGNAQAMQVAASDRDGAVGFSISANSELNAVVDSGRPARDAIEVRSATLDRMADEAGWSDIDFVKLDVEGHELQVARGGSRFFASGSPLVMAEIGKYDREHMDAFDPLLGLGYELYRLLPGPLILVPFDRSEGVDFFQLNLFACKRDRADRLAADGFLVHDGNGDGSRAPQAAWAEYLQNALYARGFAGAWPMKAGFLAKGGLGTYLDGLAAYARCRDPRVDAAQRHGLLNQAFQSVAESLDTKDTLARRVSYARLAWELGMRMAAVDALRQASGRVVNEGEQALEEPFLAPSGRYERLAAGTDPKGWLHGAVVEQFECLREFSSLYGKTSSLEVLAPVLALPFISAEMHRRCQLLHLRSGVANVPDPPRLLSVRSDENMNPHFWSRAERIALCACRGP